MFHKSIACLLAVLTLLGCAGTAVAAEVDCDSVYCFSSEDFTTSQNTLAGICITDLPSPNIGTILLMGIKLFLWSCLFVIPGIIKSYEYAIVPYILADDEEISSKDAFKKAREMMMGNKWRLFKLNFSFIGWDILCVLTLGLGTFFLLPYINAANAEFYVELKNKQIS